MAKYIIDLPEELIAVIKNLGYDPKSYINSQLINPLVDKFKQSRKEQILKDNDDMIETEAKEHKKSSKITIFKGND